MQVWFARRPSKVLLKKWTASWKDNVSRGVGHGFLWVAGCCYPPLRKPKTKNGQYVVLMLAINTGATKSSES